MGSDNSTEPSLAQIWTFHKRFGLCALTKALAIRQMSQHQYQEAKYNYNMSTNKEQSGSEEKELMYLEKLQKVNGNWTLTEWWDWLMASRQQQDVRQTQHEQLYKSKKTKSTDQGTTPFSWCADSKYGSRER